MGNSAYPYPRTALGVPPPHTGTVPSDTRTVPAVSVFLLCIYVFLIYSRMLEVFGVGTVTLVLLLLLVPCIILSGNVSQIMNDRTGRWLMAYAAWFCLAIALSNWRGGSFGVFTHRAGRALLLYVAVVVLVSRKRDFMRLVWAIGLANLFLVSRALLNGDQQEGRLVIAGGTLGDPNELAMFAIFGLFIWWLILLRSPVVLRFVPLIAVGLALIAFGKAGSRGGLVALVVAGVAHFWKSSWATKIQVAAASIVVLVLAMFLLPEYLRLRFLTFFSAGSDSQYSAKLEGNDVASTVSRQELAGQAFQMSLQHPLFGVGPGEFANTVYRQHKAGETEFINHAIHNSYLQISAEAGFPAAFLFIGALVSCLFQKPKYGLVSGKANPTRAGPSASLRIAEKVHSEYAPMIHYARITLIFVSVFAVTLSFAYDDIFMLAMALLTAAVNVANHENAALTFEAPQPSRSAVAFPR